MDRTEARLGQFVEYAIPGRKDEAAVEQTWTGRIVEILSDGRAVVLRDDGAARSVSIGALTVTPTLDEIAARRDSLREKQLAAMRARYEDHAPPKSAFRLRSRRPGK